MKKIFLMTLVFLIFSWGGSFSQDDIYGDYLIGSIDKKVSLDLEKAQLVDVLKLLSQQTGLNFISAEEVGERKVTLYMENVPLKEAMDTLFKANNLTYDYYPDSKIFIVKETFRLGLEMKTKVYYLKYARVENSKVEGHLGAMLEGSGEGSGIKAAVEAVLTKAEGAKVIEDSATNSLIVVDIPAQFSIIDEVISKLDIAPIKVMIEVEMLDVSKFRLDQMGFNFAGGLTASFEPKSRNTTFPWFGKFSGQGVGGADPTLSTLSLESFTTVIKFLTQETSTKFIARPKILTLDNETAEVRLTVNEAIGLTVTEVEGGGSTQEVEREDTGTELKVTPHVNILTKEITLVVEMSNKASTSSGLTVTGMTGEVRNVEERGTKSIIRLRDGETLLIGGLLKNQKEEIITRIPFLSDIPLIGGLFRYKNKPSATNVNRELLVFLTPRILEEEGGLINKAKIISREQQNSSRESSIKGALDYFN